MYYDDDCSVSRVQRKSSGRGRGKGQNYRERGSLGGKEGEQEVGKMKRELDATLKELTELQDRKSSLERECVIYQSQLEVYTIYCRQPCIHVEYNNVHMNVMGCVYRIFIVSLRLRR